MLFKTLKCEFDALIYQTAPQKNCAKIVALTKLIAWKRLMPQSLPTSHFNIFTYLDDLVLKNLICSIHLSFASKCIPKYLTFEDIGIISLLTCKHSDERLALDLWKITNWDLVRESSKPIVLSHIWIWLKAVCKLLIILL